MIQPNRAHPDFSGLDDRELAEERRLQDPSVRNVRSGEGETETWEV